MHRPKRPAPFLRAVLFVFCFSCTNAHDPLAPDLAYEGIVRTDSNGRVLADDPDDWMPRNARVPASSAMELRPAFPNPPLNKTTFVFALRDSAEVEVRILENPDSPVRGLFSRSLQPGLHAIEWDLRDDSGTKLEPGLYRAEISAVSNGALLNGYGDIEIR